MLTWAKGQMEQSRTPLSQDEGGSRPLCPVDMRGLGGGERRDSALWIVWISFQVLNDKIPLPVVK